MRNAYELAQQIAERIVAQKMDEAERTSTAIGEFSFEIVLGTQTYALTCRPLRPALASSELSPREKEVVRLVALGLPNKAIAQVLEISLWTVATYIRRVFAKLGVTTRAQMVARILHDDLLLLEGGAGAPYELGGRAPVEDRTELRRIGGTR